MLGLREPFERVSGFSRPNLSLNITAIEKAAQKDERMRAVIAAHKTGIVYCATRKKVEAVSETLASWGIKCVAYHGGMGDQERERAQEIFIHRKADVAVATNAFGMGIDRSDVRFVIHYEVPGSVEAYYQEAGRAGRDGENAFCELLFNYADTRTQEFFIEGANPTAAIVRSIYQYLLNEADKDFEVHRTLEEIAEDADVKNSMSVGSAMAILARGGYIERFDIPEKAHERHPPAQAGRLSPAALQLDEAAIEEKDRRDREKLKAMVEMCYSRSLPPAMDPQLLRRGGCRRLRHLRCLPRRRLRRDPRAPTDEEDLIVSKALSGVARMSRRTANGWEPQVRPRPHRPDASRQQVAGNHQPPASTSSPPTASSRTKARAT